MSIYARRWANAQRIGRRIEAALASGCLVWDAEGSPVTAVKWHGFSGHEGLSVEQTVYFDCDLEFDHGMYTPVAEFNAKFAKWTVVKPEHRQSLLEVRLV